MTNDDGYLAPNLRALRDELRTWAQVVVVAPESEQSATSHALTLHRPLRLRQVEDEVFALDGTPADCVYVGLHSPKQPLPRKPDLVVSGLNHGLNLGADVFYSGTVGGAREGALRGIPALACSAASRAERCAAAAFASRVAHRFLEVARGVAGVRKPLLFNLNIPPGSGPWALRSTVLGSRLYADQVVHAQDPQGRDYLWIGGAPEHHENIPGSDTEAHEEGLASLTPLILDLTHTTDAPLALAVAQGFSSP
ncbi:MAG: 5'/3'-nucleotidase SurE [Myxococcales bacterium]|nr:5'/3'-nucleotidase SurE [Polyangiaceae bacterium]MDW8247784.1 5'/3'-nucleotidase SurE [Myxococcales bacterium]